MCEVGITPAAIRINNSKLENPIANKMTFAKCKSVNLKKPTILFGFVAPTLCKIKPKAPPITIAKIISFIS